MDPITLRLPTDTLDEVDREANEKGLSRAEYLREIVEKRHVDNETLTDYEEKLSDYESEVERLRSDVARLQNEKRQILEQREEHTDLVRAIEREQSREDRRAQAGVLTRAKWWLVGMEDDRE